MNEAIIAKLQKILARADTSRGATQAEAEAAMAKAQQLAIEHDIDLASISLETGKIEIETDRAELDGGTATQRPHHKPIAQVLMNCFDVRFIWHGVGSRWLAKATIIGEKTDVVIATYCWKYLCDVYPELFRKYLAGRGERIIDGYSYRFIPSTEHKQRISFYEGLTVGIIKANQRQRAQAKADPSSGSSYSLVLVKKEDAVAARCAQEFPNMGTTRRREKTIDDFDQSAISAGYRAGLEIKLGGALTAA